MRFAWSLAHAAVLTKGSLECGWFALRRRLTPHILVGAVVLCVLFVPASLLAGQLDFPSVADFDILDASGSQVIGHTHFTLTNAAPGFQLINIESRFLDGEYDIEQNKVETRGRSQLPLLAKYEHRFFSSGGILIREASADFRAGRGSCAVEDGDGEKVDSATLDFPADTYAGSALLIPLQSRLRQRSKDPVEFHDFACVPGPKVLEVEASAQELTRWAHYPGQTLEVEIKPHFGWIDLVIAPFVPKMHAWFNPTDGWNFVGGQFTRYYKGPQIILARVPPAVDALPLAGTEDSARRIASAPPAPQAVGTAPTVR
jgi:hypothetical protein